tara:strand:- start:256 stop:744 length:489 start_codon:yes stop_codon:yes gene_type:complete
MAFQSTWYFSSLPEKVVDLIEKEVGEDSSVPASSWVGGFVWHFLKRANRENFCYELSNLDDDSIKYKVYNEGEGQSWHVDAKPLEDDEDKVRKLSFTVQLSDVDDYEGGNVQFLDEGGKKYNVPRQRGVVILFDSTARHRVTQVTKGKRKSLVGWAVGKRWH